MGNVIKLNGIFEESQTQNKMDNSTFTIVKMRVHGLGRNDNMSDITDEAFEKAKKSLYGIPIVSKYVEDVTDKYGNDGDLSGHNQTLKKDKDGKYVLFYDTVPNGFISPNSNITKEVVDENGKSRVYICADEVVLWGRYESTKKIKEWLDNGEIPKVSMEIGDIEGEVDDDGYLVISSYEYESVCSLSSTTTPCFKNSDIETFSTKQNFNELYQEMVNEYNKVSNFTLQNQSSISEVDIDNHNKNDKNYQEGGMSMDKIIEMLAKYSLTPNQLGFSIEDITLEELEEKVKAFTLTGSQFVEELRIEVSKEKEKTDWGYEYSKYSYCDYKDNMVYAYDREDNYKLVGFSFVTNGESVTIDFESKKRFKFEIVTFEEGMTEVVALPEDALDFAVKEKEAEMNKAFATEKETAINEVNVKLDEVNSKFTALETENTSLKEFKEVKLAEERKTEETQLFEKYAKLNGNAEFEEIKTKSNTFENISDLEKEIALVFAKNALTYSTKEEKSKTTVKLPIDHKEEKEYSAYGDLFTKYSEK